MHSRLLHSATTHYLQLMSVIQGVVLGYGVYNLEAKYSMLSTADILFVVTTLLMVMTVWDEYQLGAAVYIWVPGYRDSIIPFLFGITELLMVKSIGKDINIWFRYAAVFAVLSLIAYVNMYRSAGKEKINEYVLDRVKIYIRINYIFCTASVIIFILCWKVSSIKYNTILFMEKNVFLARLSLLTMLIFCIRGLLCRKKIVSIAKQN